MSFSWGMFHRNILWVEIIVGWTWHSVGMLCAKMLDASMVQAQNGPMKRSRPL